MGYLSFHDGIQYNSPKRDRHPHGEVRSEIVDDHILVITVDRVEKKNAFTPKIMDEFAGRV